MLCVRVRVRDDVRVTQVLGDSDKCGPQMCEIESVSDRCSGDMTPEERAVIEAALHEERLAMEGNDTIKAQCTLHCRVRELRASRQPKPRYIVSPGVLAPRIRDTRTGDELTMEQVAWTLNHHDEAKR